MQENTLIDTTGREIQYRSKRFIGGKDEHKQHDFLKGGPGDPLGVGPELGESSTRHTKFTKGFFRRPAHLINPYNERYALEENKAERIARRSMAREEYLAAQNTRHGNVVNTMQGRPHENGVILKHASDSSLQQHKTRRPVNQFHTEGENRSRQLASGSRFHAVNDQKSEARRRQRMEANIMRQIGSSSVLGYGRQDLPSYGVWDNFRMDEQKSMSRNGSRSRLQQEDQYQEEQYFAGSQQRDSVLPNTQYSPNRQYQPQAQEQSYY